MNTKLLNTINLDGGKVIIKKGSEGGGGVTINNQDKVVDIEENGITEVVADAGYTGLGKVSVNVNVASSGGGEDGGSDASASVVNFRDYDGTILHSYSKDKFLTLSALPELPTQNELICQGWNYNLEDAKAYVSKYGVLDIGAMYITDDGKTRLHIRIAEKGRMTVPLYFSQTVDNGVTIDWGDGSTTQTLSGTGNVNTTHAYTEVGEYTISLNPAEGCTLGFSHNASGYCVMGSTATTGRVYCNMLQAVEIGKNVTSIAYTAFAACYSLESVVIPQGVTSIDSYYAFNCCYSLTSVVIPQGVTSIGNYTFAACHSLTSVVIPHGVTNIGDSVFSGCRSLASVVIPDSVTNIGDSAFRDCYSLTSVVIPQGVTSISDSAFYYCYSLASVVIPDSVTSIAYGAFCDCRSLASVVIPDSVTSIGNKAFSYCHSLTSVVIPHGVTNIGDGVFSYCYSLASVVIPDSITNIGNSAFYECWSLASVVIPQGVTSISSKAFYYCYGMAYYDFRASNAVPTLSATNAFSSIPSDCKIVVPDSLYDTWIAATNWSTYASKIVKASEFNG